MIKQVIILTVFFSLIFSGILKASEIYSDNDPVLLKISDREVTISEFEYVYTKNNLNPQVMDPKSIEEYLELFINFNLKVYEALELKLDTHNSFITELDGYREQLAQPYLTDQDVTNHLLDEALNRMQYDVRASHILFNLDPFASPEDTVKIWNKAMDIRTRILDGEDFAVLARELSDDPSAKGFSATPNRPAMRGNAGDLGYFSVLDMVYPFENAAFSLPVGDVSLPVRTNYGYHLIKITDKQPSMGRATVAHIMVAVNAEAGEDEQKQAEEKINEIHEKYLAGEEFNTLAERFSDDKASARRGGELPAFTSNRMVPEFIKAINFLDQDNPVSPPVRTQFGWHLIKLIDKQKPDEETARTELKNRIGRDSRASISQDVVLERLKNEYKFQEFRENLEPFYQWVDSTVFEGKWQVPASKDQGELLFSFANKEFRQHHFSSFIAETQAMRSPESIRNYVSSLYEKFWQQKLLDYEENILPQKYPEFKRIMNEYHDGILLFELTDQKVWSKAMKDTTGLQNFYNQNISDYHWKDRYDVVLYTFESKKAAKSGRKKIRRAHKNGLSVEELMAEFNQNSLLEVTSESGIFEVDENMPALARIGRKKGVSKIIDHDGRFTVAWINEFIPSQSKKLNEIRGLVIADYQNYLERQWIEELRAKYDYSVNRDALKYLINKE